MTEQDIIAEDGSAKGGGRTDKVAQAWAEKMTEAFADLSREVSVFADLQNIMDLTVVSTLIVQEQLDKRAGLDLSVLMHDGDTIQPISYDIPKSIDPQCSFIKGRAGWVVTASGGVDINAFEIVENQTTDPTVADKRAIAIASSNSSWWWNK